MHVPPKHPLMTWLVEHAAFVRYTGVIGSDGKSAYNRVRGVEHNLRFPFFGERIRFKGRAKEGGIGGDGPRWSDGVWLGVHRRTNQYIIFDAVNGIRHARTIMRYPNNLKFSIELAQGVDVGPQQIHEEDPRETIFRRPADKSLQQGEEKNPQHRRLYVRQKDIDAFGFSDRCPRCEHEMRYGKGRSAAAHSESCCQRITEMLKTTPEGRRRLEQFELRVTQNIANQIEQQYEPNANQRADPADGGDGHVHQESDARVFVPLPASSAARHSDVQIDAEPRQVDRVDEPVGRADREEQMEAEAEPDAACYSPTSPAKSDMDMEADVVEEENDLRDIEVV